MKGLGSVTNVQDFLQDASEFLEETLATEKLSRLALEHRTRLIIKLTSLMKENHDSMERYIDMKSDPALRSFFRSDSSTSDSSSVKDKELSEKATPTGEEFYDIPVCLTEDKFMAGSQAHENRVICWSNEATGIHINVADQCDSSTISLEDYKNTNFLHQFMKADQNSKADDAPSVARRSIFMEELLHDGQSSTDANQTKQKSYVDVDNSTGQSPVYDNTSVLSQQEPQSCSIGVAKSYNVISSMPTEDRPIERIKLTVNGSGEGDYDYVSSSNSAETDLPGDSSESQNNNDSDDISLRSVTSDYSSNSPTNKWNIPAAEAKMLAVRCGFMKRRNGRKLMSAWRRCYAVLLPTQLLMYSNNSDNKPRTVVDLTAANMRVSRVLKQGMDTKLLKMQPFVLLHDEKPLYEMSTKSREDTDGWIASFQKVFSETAEVNLVGNDMYIYQEDKSNDDENVYEDLPEQASQPNLQRLKKIQCRNLPSLPHEPCDATDSPSNSNSISNSNLASKAVQNLTAKFNLFKRTQRRRSTQTNEEDTLKDDRLKAPPSPAPSATPYSSIENINHDMEDIYNSIEDIGHSEFDTSTLDLSKEDNLCKNDDSDPSESDLLIYDIPPPAVRPLSVISFQSDDGNQASISTSFARQISLRRANLLGRKSSISSPDSIKSETSITYPTDDSQIYDVPVSNKRIQEPPQEDRLRLSTPPRDTTPSSTPTLSPVPDHVPATTQVNRQQTKIQKMAQYWQEKMNEADREALRSKEPPQKSKTEIKSVGRSFSRPANQRPALTSLTELISASIVTVPLSPSQKSNKLTKEKKEKKEKKEVKGVKDTISSSSAIEVSFSRPNVKKEPPPRPPAPVRINPPPTPQKSVDKQVDTLKLLLNNESTSPTSSASPTNSTSPKTCETHEYRARWAYVAQNPLELSMNSGEIVKVVNKCGPCWLVKSKNNKKGLVPKEYLVAVEGTNSSSSFPFFGKIGEAVASV